MVRLVQRFTTRVLVVALGRNPRRMTGVQRREWEILLHCFDLTEDIVGEEVVSISDGWLVALSSRLLHRCTFSSFARKRKCMMCE